MPKQSNFIIIHCTNLLTCVAPCSSASRLLKDSNTAKDLEKLQWLVNMRDAEMKTPLHVATQAGNFHVAQALVEHGADVHAKKKNLQTSAHLAACRGKAELLGLMVSKGADLNTQDEQQRTPLHRYCIEHCPFGLGNQKQ